MAQNNAIGLRKSNKFYDYEVFEYLKVFTNESCIDLCFHIRHTLRFVFKIFNHCYTLWITVALFATLAYLLLLIGYALNWTIEIIDWKEHILFSCYFAKVQQNNEIEVILYETNLSTDFLFKIVKRLN